MNYKYLAVKDEVKVKGDVEANSLSDALIYLKNNGYFPIDVHEVETANASLMQTFFKRVSFTDIVDLTRQLAIMLNAGLTLVDAFSILQKQITKPGLLEMINTIDSDIRSGKNFSDALKRYPQYFSNLYIALIRSAEASGKLSEVMLKLAETLEKQREFQGRIKGALIYPLIIVIGMIVVMFIMITFVVPKLLGLYKDFGIDLPFSTQVLIAVSGFFAAFWPIIIGVVAAASVLANRYLKTKKGRMARDTLLLRLPVISNVLRMSTLVDSTRTLSILIGSGVSILDGLLIVTETTTNLIFQEAFNNIFKQVQKGVSLGQAMKNEGVFPPILVQMATVGEQTGHLDDTLMRISHYFEIESEIATKAMTTLIEPAILVFLGLGVGFLVMSVITPIYNLTSSFK